MLCYFLLLLHYILDIIFVLCIPYNLIIYYFADKLHHYRLWYQAPPRLTIIENCNIKFATLK